MWIKFLSAINVIYSRLVPQNTTDDKSTLVQMRLGAIMQKDYTWADAEPDFFCHGANKPHCFMNIRTHASTFIQQFAMSSDQGSRY